MKRWCIALAASVSAACVPLACVAEPAASGLCAQKSELQCIESAECTLHRVELSRRVQYQCLPAANACEQGFVQKSGTPEDCLSKAGCTFVPPHCYCAPDVVCVCGGGPPSQCSLEPKPVKPMPHG